MVQREAVCIQMLDTHTEQMQNAAVHLKCITIHLWIFICKAMVIEILDKQVYKWFQLKHL